MVNLIKAFKKINYGYLSFKWKVLFIIMLACFITALSSCAL